MSKLDVTIIKGQEPARKYNVEAGAVGSIEPGEPVKLGGTGSNYVVLLATGDPEVATDRMVGIASSTSTDTAAADGEVWVYPVAPGQTVMRARATTSSNLADGILNDSVTFDLNTGVFTVDEDEGDDPNVHGLQILDYDVDKGTVDFKLKNGAGEEGLV